MDVVELDVDTVVLAGGVDGLELVTVDVVELPLSAISSGRDPRKNYSMIYPFTSNLEQYIVMI